MQQAIDLTVDGRTLRGMEHIPDDPLTGDSLPTEVPAVIVFHGFTGDKTGSHRMYVKLSRMLETMGYASFRFDFSGSGESDGQFEQMTLSSEIREGQAILDYVRHHRNVNPEAVTLLGHSMGGVVASIIAARQPQEINKLMLLCPAGNMSDVVGVNLQDLQASEGQVPEVYDNDGDLVGIRFAQELVQMDLIALAKGFDKEVLFVHGTADEAVPVEVSKSYNERSYGGKGQLELVEGADHSFNRHDWEEAVFAAVRTFMGE